MYNQLGEHDAFFAVGYANYIILSIVHRELKRIEDIEKREEELKRKKAEKETNKVSLKV
jgi:hypothetical protein